MPGKQRGVGHLVCRSLSVYPSIVILLNENVIGLFKANTRPTGLNTLGVMNIGGSTKGSFKVGTTPMRSLPLRADLCFPS